MDPRRRDMSSKAPAPATRKRPSNGSGVAARARRQGADGWGGLSVRRLTFLTRKVRVGPRGSFPMRCHDWSGGGTGWGAQHPPNTHGESQCTHNGQAAPTAHQAGNWTRWWRGGRSELSHQVCASLCLVEGEQVGDAERPGHGHVVLEHVALPRLELRGRVGFHHQSDVVHQVVDLFRDICASPDRQRSELLLNLSLSLSLSPPY